MKYCKSYCEEKEISTSKLSEAQKTLYYIAESMKVSRTIGEEGYRHFQEAIEALEQEPILDKIRAEIEQLPTKTRINWDGCCPDIECPEIEYVDIAKDRLLSIIDKYRTESEVKERTETHECVPIK